MAYDRINWQNEPSEATALNDVNLNKMDSAIYDHDQRLDTAEGDIEDIESDVATAQGDITDLQSDVTTAQGNITALQNGKVDKISGKGLCDIKEFDTSWANVDTGTWIGAIKYKRQSSSDFITKQIYNGVVVDTALSDSSNNPVRNKVVKGALDNKVDKEEGKGLSTLSALGVTASATTGTQIADIIAYDQSGTEYHNPIKNGVVVDSALSNSSENPVQNKVVKESISDILPTNTATGNPITITDGMKLPATECKVTMLPIQDLSHGDPSPTNICPISGRDSVTVTRTGKNLIPKKYYQYNSANLFLGLEDLDKEHQKYLTEGTYTFKIYTDLSSPILNYAEYDGQTHSTTGNAISFTVTTPNYYRFWVNKSGVLPSNIPEFQLEKNASATDYEPYQGETHTHTYSSTVYGGEDDFVSGEGESEWGIVDFGDLNWVYDANYSVFTANHTNVKFIQGTITCISSCYKVADRQSSAAVDMSIYTRQSGGSTGFGIKDSGYTDATAFKTARTGQKICYELATPTQITNTPEDISLLKGVNVLSTDGDSLELKYSGEIQSSSGVDYSTDEQDTGIKWIDGKTIYQKTLTGTISRGEYEYYFLCVIGTLSNANLIKSEGVVWNDTYQLPLNSAGTTNSMPTGDLQTFLYNRAGTLCLTLTQDTALVGYNYAVTIYYTKG